MKLSSRLSVLVLGLTVACNKQKAEDHAATSPTVQAPAAAPANDEDAEREARKRAEKEAALAFATEEDSYINDAKGQWAKSAKASSTFGEEPGREPSKSNVAENTIGAPDTRTWTNNKQDMGFDTLETTFEKPVTATAVRVVVDGGVEAISKIEVGDGSGSWTAVWQGLSDIKRDKRGSRTWFVKTFEPTKTKVSAVKVTFANQVETGYKIVDAVQLVGE